MDFLSVRNRRGKGKDHDLNTVFGPLGNRLRSSSNSQSRKAAKTSGQVFRHSQTGNASGPSQESQVISDIKIQMING